MADISRYSIYFSADPSKAVDAFGKLGKAAKQSAKQVESSFKSVSTQPSGLNNLNQQFQQLSKGANFTGLQNSLKGIQGIAGQVTNALGSMGGMLGNFGSAFGGMIGTSGPIGLAIAAVTALVAITINAAHKIDEMAKAAKRLEISIETFQVLKFVADESAVSFDELNSILIKMGGNLVEAQKGTGETAKALQQLGLSAEALLGQSPEQRLITIANRMKELNLSVEEQGKLWEDIGGKAAKGNFVTFVQGLAGQMELARHELELMNAMVSGDTADTAEFLADMVGRIQLIFDSIGNILVSTIGPFISKLLIAVQAIWAVLAPIVKFLGDLVGAILAPFNNLLTLVIQSLRNIAVILNVIFSVISLLLMPLQMMGKLWEKVFAKLDPAFKKIEIAFMAISKKIQGIAEHPALIKIIDGISSLVSSLLVPALEGFANLVESLLDTFEWVIDKIEWLINHIPGLPSSGTTGSGSVASKGIKDHTALALKELEELGKKLAEGLKGFSLDEFSKNFAALNAALNAGKLKFNQYNLAVADQIKQLKNFVGASTTKVGQQALLQGSVESVTLMLETMYGKHYKTLQEELNALMAEAVEIERLTLEEAKLHTAALREISGLPPIGGTGPTAPASL